jgi:hypothetical protein
MLKLVFDGNLNIDHTNKFLVKIRNTFDENYS